MNRSSPDYFARFLAFGILLILDADGGFGISTAVFLALCLGNLIKWIKS